MKPLSRHLQIALKSHEKNTALKGNRDKWWPMSGRYSAACVCGGAEWNERRSLGGLPEVTPKIMPHGFPLGLRLAPLVVIPASRMGFFLTDRLQSYRHRSLTAVHPS